MNRLKLTPELIRQFEELPTDTKSPHVYILREREFIRLDEKTYKIGETTKPLKRFRGYPKETELLYFRNVKDSLFVESVAKQRFRHKFKHMIRYGHEYFSGVLSDMICEMDSVVVQCSLTERVRQSLPIKFSNILKPKSTVKHLFTPRQEENLSKTHLLKFPKKQLSKSTEKKFSWFTSKYNCPLCKKNLASDQRLKSHLLKRIPCNLVCCVCHKKFNNVRSYSSHYRTHSIESSEPKMKFVSNAETNVGLRIKLKNRTNTESLKPNAGPLTQLKSDTQFDTQDIDKSLLTKLSEIANETNSEIVYRKTEIIVRPCIRPAGK